ncbi:MAG: TRAP transporter large permease subunit [Arenicellales bacterium]|jgi:tripartite ATP-independent transporter DctM subunit|nr:C4-dicarboxylate ABC transporter permease [Acidiferrobacteraceae bacterium]MDP6268352.1 TRAP transporter large permease subunit [Arenicellales bacterium]MDP6734566.1 TRAP transporter large permease subunit [Gammaproteobacteria bacterium]MDP6412493.1 TRAP transporter large permease subunit [Arenicellales bacterium]MDP7452480.1 TRAP transporter large permease subunit [Arenicellales bacterium]|tara:strand:- start:553 stop:1872 length:1320 start_codon:yes stop_codon:yes gene_type:complete
MSIEILTLIMLGSMVVLLVIGLPLAFVTGIIAFGFALFLYGPFALPLIASRIYGFVSVYALIAVPMFVFMASVLERSGIARDLFGAMHVLSGNLRGGLAIQTMAVAVLMAAMTGIIGGEIVLLGLVALPQMLRLNYDRKLAIGTVCAGGGLGTMIPPSIVLIFYGLTAQVSIGDLFLATVIPGLLLAGIYIAYILIRCYINPDLGPPAPVEERNLSFAEKLVMVRDILLPVLVVFMVLGSIYGGIASVSEAAGMGVIGVILCTWIRKELKWQLIRESLHQTMMTCGVILWLVFGATALIGVYNLMGGIDFVKNLMTGLPFPPIMILLIMMAILLVLGFFIDWIGIMLLTMPVFVPIVVEMGYDPIWFGILFCMNMQISYLSPPFGPAAFYLKGVAPPEISLQDIYNSLWPFMALQILGLAIVMAFPQLALWLPSLAYPN